MRRQTHSLGSAALPRGMGGVVCGMFTAPRNTLLRSPGTPSCIARSAPSRKQQLTHSPWAASPQELALLWSQPLICPAGTKKGFSEESNRTFCHRAAPPQRQEAELPADQAGPPARTAALCRPSRPVPAQEPAAMLTNTLRCSDVPEGLNPHLYFINILREC